MSDEQGGPAEPQPEPHTDPAPEPEPEPDPEPEPERAGYRLRRAPRYRAFGYTGAGIGILIGVILVFSIRAGTDYSASSYSTQTILGYFAAMFGLVGGILGLGIAVLIERRRS